ncbi:MAG: hypothetical protein ACKVTZ_04900 [Bacteroidia bacterium]
MHNHVSTPTRVTDIELFYLILECYGWECPSSSDLEECNIRFNNPEAILAFSSRKTILEIGFHEPLNLMSLRISDVFRKQSVLFHFMYNQQPEKLLEWFAAVSEELTLENYPELLKQASSKCEMILLEVNNQQMYEVIPPHNGQAEM